MKSINQLTQKIFEQQHPIFFSPKTDSTNAWAKQDFHGQTPFALYLADEQSLGRGRGANVWLQGAPGSTLLSTWCLRLAQTPQPLFPMRVGLLLFESCLKVWPHLEWSLKAPNDIYILDGKWAGILIEVSKVDFNTCCFIGIGANVFDKPAISTQKTTALTDWGPVETSQWQQFCRELLLGLTQLQIDPARQNLLPSEIKTTEYGLKKFIGNNVKTVLADGSLILNNDQKIHWSDF